MREADPAAADLPSLERMDGVDAGFLYMETPTAHMHTLKISLIEPAATFEFTRFAETMIGLLHQLPPLQRRVLPVPFALNHPLWIVDQPVDPRRHLFEHRLPTDSGMAELEAEIGRIASTPLDRSVPLWEMHVCHGLADGRVAVVGKMHHALADGVAANALLGNVTDQAAAGSRSLGVATPVPTPSGVRQVRMALVEAAVQALSLPGLLMRTARSVTALVRHQRQSSVRVPRPVLDAPRTPFNAALTARRSFATAVLPLAEVKAVRERYGVTVNDVVLATVSGALRQWLSEAGELPATSLVAGVPVAADDPGAPARLGGNRVSNLFTTLATDLDDPVARLREIARVTTEAKAVQAALGRSMLVDWVQFTPPGPFAALLRLYSRRRVASRHSPPFNVIVSNVRGPSRPVTIAGTPLHDLFSVGPLMEGMGLNVTAWSYVDRLNVSVLSCPDLVEDLGAFTRLLAPALQELLSTGSAAPAAPAAAAAVPAPDLGR